VALHLTLLPLRLKPSDGSDDDSRKRGLLPAQGILKVAQHPKTYGQTPPLVSPPVLPLPEPLSPELLLSELPLPELPELLEALPLNPPTSAAGLPTPVAVLAILSLVFVPNERTATTTPRAIKARMTPVCTWVLPVRRPKRPRHRLSPIQKVRMEIAPEFSNPDFECAFTWPMR
jgi:hypothetical protein